MSEPTMIEVLTRVVEKHLPSSKALTRRGSVHGQRSERWAKALLDADFHCDDRFGVSRDAPALEAVVRAAQHLQNALQAVSWPTATVIDGEALAISDPSHLGFWQAGDPSAMNDAFHAAENIERAADQVLRLHRHRPEAGTTNWRAASVVAECRKVWAEEEFLANPSVYGAPTGNALSAIAGGPEAAAQYERYLDHLQRGAPRTLNHQRPARLGNFGGFVEDVFEALGLVRDDGAPFSAASALRAWRKASKQETEK